MTKSGLFNVKISDGFMPDRVVEGGIGNFVEFICIPLHVETGRYKKIQVDLIKSTSFDDLGNVEIYMTNGEMFGTKSDSLSNDVIKDLKKLSS